MDDRLERGLLAVNLWTVIIAVVVLRPDMIGPEELVEIAPDGPQKTSPQESSKNPKGKPWSRDTLHLNDQTAIDQTVFLREFRRQAERDGLFACLSAAHASPGSILVGGTLLTTGAINDVHPVGTGISPPQCMPAIISKMKFPQTAKSLTTASHTVIWRVDW